MAKNKPKQKTAPNKSRHILPCLILLWTTVFLTILIISALAILGLLSPNIAKKTTRDGSIPQWSFIVIALSCAAGTLALSQWLNRQD